MRIKMINEILVTSILNKHKKRDDWFLDDYSINPYQGCPFNCVYCFTRGSKYGTNLAKTLSVKANAPELLEKQLSLRARKGQYGIIALASQEPYPPAEKDLGMTRRLLEIVLRYQFPVTISTKSTLIIRDLDLLKEIDKNAILPEDLKNKLKHGVILATSISTLDEGLVRLFEPGAPTPRERLETIRRCKDEGFLAGVNFIPVLPFLSDSDQNLEEMISTARAYGLDFVLVGGLTLFGKGTGDCKTLYYQVLEQHFPGLISRYKSLFRIFFSPPKEYQKSLEERSREFCKRYGIRYGTLNPIFSKLYQGF
jgi:DNA repair photolyase